MDFYGFYRGQEFEAYEYLGAHLQGDTAVFRTFAPAAEKVSVLGEFSGWEELPMEKVYDGNFWEVKAGGAERGQMYKLRIYRKDGSFIDHCDPYGFWSELRPGTASRLYGQGGSYEFHDAEYRRRRKDYDHSPVNIYELQAGSWRIPDPSDKEKHYTYRELADLLVPYLKEMHYTHLEVLPLTEYPSDESWGYQTTGFYAPTSRYGTPDDLRYLIDRCHAADIGVILDFVAVHFAANDYALLQYDGTALYEYPSSDVGRSEWGTCNFMHSRGEVRSFLQSSVYYWLKEFHFDGIRVDAVSNLIYWQGDESRGVNASAVQFLQTMNAGIKERMPNALLIAEDSSAYAGVTDPVREGGLGFDYKWDLGWMNDTLSYMKAYPDERKWQYHKLTFSIQYYYNEKYVMPLSHDEVVHGKATIVQKMNGEDMAGKLRQARLLYAYMFAHPGKKLNFMGNELGGFYEWSEKTELDWWLLRDKEEHRRFHEFMRELNRVYAENPSLWAQDYEREGFAWTDCRNEGRGAVYSFLRRGGGQILLAVFNFDEFDVYGYDVTLEGTITPAGTPVSDADGRSFGRVQKLLDTAEERWEAAGVSDSASAGSEDEERNGAQDIPASGATCAAGVSWQQEGRFLAVDIPALSAQFYLIAS